MRNIGIVIVLVLWVLMGWKMCTDYADCCSEATVSQSDAGPPSAIPASDNCPDGIICFSNNSCDPIYGSKFSSYKDSIIDVLGANRLLSITGIYDASETYEGEASNLGACRAQSIRSAFDNLSDERIRTGGQIMVGRDVPRNGRFLIEVMDARPNERDLATSESSGSGDSSASAGSDSDDLSADAVIYFPFNSTNKLDDTAIESYLQQVAEQIKGTGQKVKLTGHTDDIGGAASNLILGQRRANIIADYLMGQGVLRSQITAESKGETQPVASNSTETGRSRNRRTELQIIK